MLVRPLLKIERITSGQQLCRFFILLLDISAGGVHQPPGLVPGEEVAMPQLPRSQGEGVDHGVTHPVS